MKATLPELEALVALFKLLDEIEREIEADV